MNWRALCAAIFHSVFASLVVAAVGVLFYVSYMTAHYSIMGIVSAMLFFALVWEFYFHYAREEENTEDPHFIGHWEEHKKRWPVEDR